MSPKYIHAKLLIKSIHEESEKKFGCKNYQFIAERLEEELINNVEFKRSKGKENKIKEQLRNLEILEAVINGFKYGDLKFKYKLDSDAAIATIAKRTAESLDTEVRQEIKYHPPKRIFRMFSAHLLVLIETKRNLLNKQLKNIAGNEFLPEEIV